MEDNLIKFPDNRNYEYALNQSFQLAAERLAKIENLDVLCIKSNSLCQWLESGRVIVTEFLGRNYRIELPELIFSVIDSGEEVPLKERVLILHYLLEAMGTPLSNTLITFKEIPEGPVYFRTFTQRTIKHLVNNFSNQPQRLMESGKAFGARKAEYGDMAITIDAFKRVPITLVLWMGDDEFPPEGNILYDSTVTDYLPTEDIIILTETLIWRLVKAAAK